MEEDALFDTLIYFTRKLHIVRVIDNQYNVWVYSLVDPKVRDELIGDLSFTLRYPPEVRRIAFARGKPVWRFR